MWTKFKSSDVQYSPTEPYSTYVFIFHKFWFKMKEIRYKVFTNVGFKPYYPDCMHHSRNKCVSYDSTMLHNQNQNFVLNNVLAQNERNIIFCTWRENWVLYCFEYIITIMCTIHFHTGSNIQSTWISRYALGWSVWKVGRSWNGNIHTNWFCNIDNGWRDAEIFTENGRDLMCLKKKCNI